MQVVSVVMSTYNEDEVWLRNSIESILNQTYKNIEFIIINDNPNNTKLSKIINEYGQLDSRIVVINNEKNLGLIKSLNKGLERSRGKYIARMDADDISEIDRIEKQIKYLNNNMLDFIGTDISFIDELGNITNNTSCVKSDHELIVKGLKNGNMFNHPTWLFKATILDSIKGYNDVEYIEDYDFVCRVVLAGYKVGNINQKLVKYRIRLNGICKSNQLIQHRKQYLLGEIYKNVVQGKSQYSTDNLKLITLSEREIKDFDRYAAEIDRFTRERSKLLGIKLIITSLKNRDRRVRLLSKIIKIIY